MAGQSKNGSSLAAMQKEMAELKAMREQLLKQEQPMERPTAAPKDESSNLEAMQREMEELKAYRANLLKKEGSKEKAKPKEESHPWQQHAYEVMQSPGAAIGKIQDSLTAIPRWLGAPIPSSSEIRQSVYKPVTTSGKMAETASEYAGEVAGMLPYGSGVVAGAKMLGNAGMLGARGAKVAKGMGDYVLGTMPKTGSQAARLAKFTGAGAASSSALQHLGGVDPLWANLAMPAALVGKAGAQAAYGKAKSLLPTPAKGAAKSLRNALGEESTQNILRELDQPNTASFPEGYQPSAAEFSQDPTLIALERAHYATNPEAVNQSAHNMGVLNKSVESLAPTDASFANTLRHANETKANQQSMFEEALNLAEAQRTKGVSDIKAPSHVSHQEYGEGLREGLSKTVAQHEKARSAATKPLYDRISKSTDLVEVQPTYDIFDELAHEGIQGAAQADMRVIKNALKSQTEKGMSEDVRSLIGSLQKEKANPELIASVLDKAGVHPSKATARQIHHVMKSVIDPRMTQAAKAQDWGRYRNLHYIKDSLHDALDVVPDFAAANKTYREMSKPINEIMRDPGLAPLLKTDVYKTAHSSRAASHLDKFIYGKNSEEHAGALVKSLGKDKETMGKMREYVRHEFVNDVVDPVSGEVNLKKIAQWRKDNQGAFKVDPELAKQAHALEASQTSLNQIEHTHKVTSKQSKAVFDALLERDAPIVVKGIMSSPKSGKLMSDVIELAKKDASGESLNGLKRGVADYLTDNLSLAAQTTKGDYNLSFNTLRANLKRSEEPLKQLFGEEGWGDIQKVFNALKSRNRIMTAGSAVGSPTESYQQLVGLLSDSLDGAITSAIPTQWARNIAKGGVNIWKKKKKERVMHLLSSPEAFKEAMGGKKGAGLKEAKKANPLKEASRSTLLTFLNG
jgi:hypothetical protein